MGRNKAARPGKPAEAGQERKSARECALFLLEYGDRTEAQMRQKLRERDYTPQEIEDALLFLKEYRYIDDAAYAGRYVRSAASRKSARQIRAALEQKGVDRELIAAALEEQPVDEEGQICAFLQKKGCRPGERLEPAEYRRLLAALARRGFSYDAIRRVMSGLSEADFGEN